MFKYQYEPDMHYSFLLFLMLFGLVSCVVPHDEAVMGSSSALEKEKKAERKSEYTLNWVRYSAAKKETTRVKISLWDQKAWLLNENCAWF